MDLTPVDEFSHVGCQLVPEGSLGSPVSFPEWINVVELVLEARELVGELFIGVSMQPIGAAYLRGQVLGEWFDVLQLGERLTFDDIHCVVLPRPRVHILE
ncbi:hypothetical protein ACX80E_03125 [Arthrobacter sp. TMN-49]